MPLDPQVKDYLDRMAGLNLPSFHTMPVAESRSMFHALRSMVGKLEPVGFVENRTLPGSVPIPVRIYTPNDDASGPRPALLFYHGGGWVLGGLDTVDALCRRLANASGCVVISVAYRLAPEHKFPAPLDDCYEAAKLVEADASAFGVDPARIAVGGDSAGGNLAASVALMAWFLGGPKLAFQLLIYPITDHDLNSPSYLVNADGYGLSREMMAWYWDQYLAKPADGRSQLASPLKAEDLFGLPTAFVMTAEYDVLRDEGDAYAARLRESGVAVEHRCYEGQIHGFIQLGASFPTTQAAIGDAARALRDALGR